MRRRRPVYPGFNNRLSGADLAGVKPSYLYLPGVSSNYATTPDSVPLSITGDLAAVVGMAVPDWSPADFQRVLSKLQPTGNQRSWRFDLLATGQLQTGYSTDGVAVEGNSSTANLSAFANNSFHYVAFAFDANNGAGGHTTRFYSSSDGGTFTQLGADVVVAGAITLFDSTADVEIGAVQGGVGSNNLAGLVYLARIYDGIPTFLGGTGGTLVSEFNPAAFTPGTTSLKMYTGEIWTVGSSGTPPAVITNA